MSDGDAHSSVYTTHQAAKLFGVSLPTIVNWIKAGRIAAYRTPGGHRRIRAGDLLAFARDAELPVPPSLRQQAVPARRVLLVDDQTDFAEGVAAYLKHRGKLEVAVAGSGFEAGLMVQRFKPAVVVMDITMPDLDGFDALLSLRAHEETRGLPVIACASFRDPGLDARVRDHDFFTFLEKPMDLEHLLECIEGCLGARD